MLFGWVHRDHETCYTAFSVSVQCIRHTSLRRYLPSLIDFTPYILIPSTMQFFKSTILLAVAFVTFAAAAPSGETLGKRECKPPLQSCAINAECCGDLCVVGVSIPARRAQLDILINFVISQLCI